MSELGYKYCTAENCEVMIYIPEERYCLYHVRPTKPSGARVDYRKILEAAGYFEYDPYNHVGRLA